MPPAVHFDHNLAAAVRHAMTEANEYDVRKLLTIYDAFVDLAQTGDEFALQHLPVIERRLRQMAGFGAASSTTRAPMESAMRCALRKPFAGSEPMNGFPS